MQTSTASPIDAEILARCSPSVRARVRLEIQIVDTLIQRANDLGHTLHVWPTGEDEEYAESYDVKQALFDLDDAYVFIHDSEDNTLGWVRLVFGNYGFDLISDYSLSAEEFLKPVLALSDSLA